MSTQAPPGKYLTFSVDKVEYAIGIMAVKEIIGAAPTTLIPGSPKYIRGIMRRRNLVIPVLDLRRRFELNETEQTPETAIIIIEKNQGAEKPALMVGLMVDQVFKVTEYSEENIQSTDTILAAQPEEFVIGLAKTEDSATILLDTDRLLANSEEDKIAAMATV